MTGFDDALARAREYLAAGADVVFFDGVETREQLEAIPKLIDAPVMANMVEGGVTPFLPAPELEAMGYAIAIYPTTPYFAAIGAMRDVLKTLGDDGTSDPMADRDGDVPGVAGADRRRTRRWTTCAASSPRRSMSAYDLLHPGTGCWSTTGECVPATSRTRGQDRGDRRPRRPRRRRPQLSAEGHLVLPGGIDPTCTSTSGCGTLISQRTRRAAARRCTAAPPRSSTSRRGPEGGSLIDAVDDKRAGADGEICCDYALHLIVAGAIGDDELSEVEAVVKGGVTTVKSNT